jgi:hypothetical protein
LDEVEVQSIQAWGRWQKQRVIELDEIDSYRFIRKQEYFNNCHAAWSS